MDQTQGISVDLIYLRGYLLHSPYSLFSIVILNILTCSVTGKQKFTCSLSISTSIFFVVVFTKPSNCFGNILINLVHCVFSALVTCTFRVWCCVVVVDLEFLVIGSTSWLLDLSPRFRSLIADSNFWIGFRRREIKGRFLFAGDGQSPSNRHHKSSVEWQCLDLESWVQKYQCFLK